MRQTTKDSVSMADVIGYDGSPDVNTDFHSGTARPMRIAVLSDIHANLEALRACLAHARDADAERYVFLGDIVGYGADPGACVDIVGEACADGALVVRGNHDEAIGETRFRLNPVAAAAVAWTASVLSPAQKSFLGALPLSATAEGCYFVHASASRPRQFPYIHGVDEASDSFMATDARLTVCGHVHAPALYHVTTTGKVMGFVPVAGTPIPMSSIRRWLAVMGAVGQPRDGNPAAAYGIIDTMRAEITFVRVPYDVEAAAAKIRAAGLPDALWKRLAEGR